MFIICVISQQTSILHTLSPRIMKKQTFKILYTNLFLICLCHLLWRIIAVITSQLHFMAITTATICSYNFRHTTVHFSLDLYLQSLTWRVTAGTRTTPVQRGCHLLAHYSRLCGYLWSFYNGKSTICKIKLIIFKLVTEKNIFIETLIFKSWNKCLLKLYLYNMVHILFTT